MAGAPLHGAGQLRRGAAGGLHRRARVQPGGGPLRRGGAGRLAVLEPDGPLQHARHGPVVLDGGHALRAAAGPAPWPRHRRDARLDVGVLGRDGARGALQGPRRPDPARRRAGALHADRARLGAVEAPVPGQRPGDLLRDRHAVVRAGAAAQSRVLQLLLHRPAVPPLPDARAEPPGPPLLLRAGAAGGLPALAVDRRAEPAPRAGACRASPTASRR